MVYISSHFGSEQWDRETYFTLGFMAKVNKGNYVVDHSILFHFDQVEGQKVCQLCVPEYKRNTALQLAHDFFYLVVILPSGSLVNAFVCHFTGQSYDRVSNSM